MKLRVAIAITFALLLALGGANAAGASDSRVSSIVEDASCAGAQAAGPQAAHHAGLVVVFDEERVETLCIAFTEDEISGAELLRRSGLPVVLSGFGGLGTGVCRIDDVGCSDPTDCFCQCSGAECSYWAYYTLEDGMWEYLPIGPSQRRLRDGDVDAWVWGSGRQRPATTGGVCPERAPSPTPAGQPPPPGGALVSTATPVVPATSDDAERPDATAVASGAARPQATPGDRGTPQVRRDGSDGGPGGRQPVETPDDGSGGPAAGLIAFGVVAGVAIAAIGALVVRRRLHG